MTQAIMERRRRAKEAEGAKIAQSHAPQVVARYHGRVRFYVSDDYRRQHPQYRASLQDLVDAAAGVVGPAFAISLESSEQRDWSPSCDREQLASCLDELRALDAGNPDVWIVGVLGDSPHFSTSFEQLGVAHWVSSHFVLRDVADLAEREQIDRAFPTHTEGQRAEIYTRRKRHRRLAVFLHEWAHTLGGLHGLESSDLLYPAYDDRMTAFGEDNAYLISIALESRFREDPARLRDYVERVEPNRFAPGEHARLLAQLQQGNEPRSAPALQPTKPAAPDEQLTSQADRDAFLAAHASKQAGTYARGWQQLSPLVERYPSSRAIQELACSLTMQLGMMSAAQASCTRVQALGH